MTLNQTATACFLGTFKGFNTRNERPVPHLLTAREVIEWDHDTQGETHFFPSGDASLIQRIFNYGEVMGADLMALSLLVDDLGGSTEEALLRVHFACTKFDDYVTDLTVDILNRRRPMIFSGKDLSEVQHAAVVRILGDCGTDSSARGTIGAREIALRDPEAFLASPTWLTMKTWVEDRTVLMVLRA